MIYYERTTPEPDNSTQTVPTTVMASDGSTVTKFAQSNGLVLVAAGIAILIGTIIEDVFTAGIGIGNDPATNGAAMLLIQKGVSFAPAY